MNRRMVVYRIGQLLLMEAALMVIPLAVAALYGEWSGVLSFAAAMGTAVFFGVIPLIFFRPENDMMFAREGYTIVTFAWILLSLVGALPFFLSREIPNYIDAVFETVSGLTTTGASLLTDVEKMSRGMLFWRSFTHWIGGMGILVLMMAIIPTDSGRSMHIMRAEMPGPVVGKLVPKIKDTAKILYVIYFVLTAVEAVLLLLGGMPLYDSVVHALGTAGTGGFGIKGDSIGGYNAYLQWVIAIFMVIFGINFNLYYMLLLKRFSSFVRNTELWLFFGIVIVSTTVIAINIFPIYGNAGDSIRQSFFQVTSIMSTTGYSTADFNLWPSLSKGILFVLMFVGGCAGSTAGGLKISRILIMAKAVYNDLRRQYHPRSVTKVKIDGKPLDDNTLNRVGTYFIIYMMLNVLVFLLISFEPFGFESNLTAAVTCVNNVGPGLGAVGPAGNYDSYSDFSTIILSLAMLLGRLEIFPVILACNPNNWVNKNK